MNIIETKTPQVFGTIANTATAIGKECMVYLINPFVCVWSGANKFYNEKYCSDHNIDVEHAEYIGGSIVNMLGDLSICIVSWGTVDIAQQITEYVTNWLRNRGISITTDENDVLADGKKVISWARAMTLSGWSQNVVHFSVGPMDLDLIKSICTKPMQKIPGSLLDYNITAHEILRIILMSGLLPVDTNI